MHFKYLNLDEYIKTFPRGLRATEERKLAEEMGVSHSSIRHWRSGRRNMTYLNALKLEAITSGKVPCFVSRPDIYPHQSAEHNVSKDMGDCNKNSET